MEFDRASVQVDEKVLQRSRGPVPLMLLTLLLALSTTSCARPLKIHSRAELHRMQETVLPLPSHFSPVLSSPWFPFGLSVVMRDRLTKLFVCKTLENT